MTQKMIFKDWEVTRDRVREYVQRRFAAHPTYTENMWDEEKHEFVTVVKTNSVHYELCCIIGRKLFESLSQYSKFDLIDELHSLYMEGSSKPVFEMTEDELVEEIWADIIQPAMDDDPDLTWENFLNDMPIWTTEK